jgi:TolB-like protein/tetratricopeptide (TPR) repeat protein/tRNA A-37 threonylcarbamoyl transferase component Bud32
MPTDTRACPACQTPLPEQAHFCLNCGSATPTDPGTPPRTTAAHDLGELGRVRRALASEYKVERALGAGGMATVYLAEDVKHRRKVAVKVMRPELAATVGADRFLREVEIAAQLSHPHILPVYDSGAADGILYYVMPYVEGESLQERMQRESQLPVEDALRIAREVADALAYAHERNIIHRDIKPANIMLSRGHALVADFGIARAMGGGASITQTGLAVGTPQYMSPEQASGSSGVDGRADVYALGCVLYEMLAGEAPFTGPTPQAIITRSLTENPRSLTMSRVGLPPTLDGIVIRALAKSPADRFQSPGALSDALSRATDFSTGSRVAPEATSGQSPMMVWGLFAFASAVTLGIFYGMVNRWGLPVWVLWLAIVLLAIGAVVLFITGKMEARRRAGAATPGLLQQFTWKNAALGGVLALGAWAVVVTGLVLKGPGGGGTGGAVRLAVLPFENRGTAEDAYFVDGIADQVRGKLTGLGGFQVTARTSTDQYRQTTKSPQVIGKELGVDYLLGATVVWAKSGDGKGRVQVSPELIDVRTGASKWQQSFDASVNDVFQVQGSIATQVAGALGVALGGKEQQQLAERPTDNLPAYDLYLKGQALTGNDPATRRQAAGFYDQAVALDSSFTLAWAGLSSALSGLYFNGTPDPGVGSRARLAAERALAIDPKSAAGHAALARYYLLVAKSPAQASEQMTQALAITPNDPDLLTAAGATERSLGQWDAAVQHLQLARRLDPRSARVAGEIHRTLVTLRRYPEAIAAGNDAIALAPASLNVVETQMMAYLGQGDLPGARAVVAAVPATVAQPALVAYLALYNDLYWVLNDAEQQLLLRLPVSAFFDDPAAMGSVKMQVWWMRGDKAKARAYADTARAAFEEQLRAAPDDPQLHVLYGLALAYMGKKAEAIAEGEKSLALMPISKDAANGAYDQHQLARIYILVGEPEKALDQIEPLLKIPYLLSPGWLRIDPAFAPLKGNPRFERLVAGN